MSEIARILLTRFAGVPLVATLGAPPLPIPPVPPDRPPSAELAPVPNSDTVVPLLSRDAHGVALGPSFFAPPEQFRGDGFAPGSTIQQVQERRLRPIPGVRLSVPIN